MDFDGFCNSFLKILIPCQLKGFKHYSFLNFNYVYIHVSVYGYVCMCAGVCGVQGVQVFLELGFQMAASSQMWVLGTEFWSSPRASIALNPRDISPVPPNAHFFYFIL